MCRLTIGRRAVEEEGSYDVTYVRDNENARRGAGVCCRDWSAYLLSSLSDRLLSHRITSLDSLPSVSCGLVGISAYPGSGTTLIDDNLFVNEMILSGGIVVFYDARVSGN